MARRLREQARDVRYRKLGTSTAVLHVLDSVLDKMDRESFIKCIVQGYCKRFGEECNTIAAVLSSVTHH